MSLRVKGIVVVLIPVLALLLSGAGLVALEWRQGQAAREETRAYRVRAATFTLLVNLISAENSVRGYVATDEPKLLARYQEHDLVAAATLGELQWLAQGDPALIMRLDRASELIERSRKVLERVASASLMPKEEVKLILASSMVTREIRDTLDAMIAEQQRTIMSRQADSERIRQHMLALTMAGLLVGVTGGLIASHLFTSGVLLRVRRLEDNAGRVLNRLPPLALPPDRDEIGRLGRSWSQTAGLLMERERSLQAREAELRNLFNAMRDLVMVLDARGTHLKVAKNSPALPRSASELVGKTLDQVYPPDLAGLFLGKVLEALSTGRTVEFEQRIMVRGQEAWFSICVSPLDQERVLWTAHDTTSRRQAEDALRQREAEVRALVEHAPDIIARYDSSRRRVYVNQAMELFFGVPREKLLGRSVGETPLVQAHMSQYYDALDRVFETGRQEEAELSFPSPKGERTVQVRLTPEATSQGRVDSVLAIGREITELKRLERELRAAVLAAEQANQAKSVFLATMSHEIRTPLNGIIGLTGLALDKCQETEAQRYLELIRQSGQTLLDLIRDILDLSKIESGTIELDLAPLSLRDTLSQTLRPLELSARGKGLSFRLSVSDLVPDRVVGDRLRLKQVLSNLVVNAIKYTERGFVEILVEPARTGPGEEEPGQAKTCLLFSVADTGRGIPADRLESIFETFSQVGRPDLGRQEGVGLGLSISRRLVELMGGRIWAESQPGQGSTFRFTVEVSTREEGVSQVPPEPGMETGATGRESGAGGRGLRILLAEDNSVNRLLATEILNGRGHEVATAVNGREALDKLTTSSFDLVLMDVRMPVMDGEELVKIIRSSPPPGVDPHVPVVALTAHAVKGDRERFMALGMDDYLAKPLDVDELDRVLWRFGRRHEQRSG